MNVKELIELLKGLPADMEVINQDGEEVLYMFTITDAVILSSTDSIGVCLRTNTPVFRSVVEGYDAYSPELDEDLYNSEFKEKE
jgi:hypothetical protein